MKEITNAQKNYLNIMNALWDFFTSKTGAFIIGVGAIVIGMYQFYISKPILKYEAEHTNIVSSTDVTDLKVTVREKEYKDMINRLSRIEGQVRGVKRMVEEDAYCPDILIQVSAINAALNSFNKVLLANHIRTCVAEDIREGKDETIDELVVTLQKLMK